jgi:hypothetical protein
MKININQLVRVRFTRHGRDVALRTSCTMKQFNSGEFQLWELMQLFGHNLYNGMPDSLFENNEIEVVE